MKTIKTDFGMKIKMLLDKTENDDKLINMLKVEISRLENIKGVKSNIKTDIPKQAANPELNQLRMDSMTMKNTIKCQDIEIEQLKGKMNKMMVNIVGAPDEMSEDRELMIVELEERNETLEKQLFKIKQE